MTDSERIKEAIRQTARSIVEELEGAIIGWRAGGIEDYEIIRLYGHKVKADISPLIDPYEAIQQERKRQDEKWGQQNHDDLYWLGILMEEVGEVAQHVIEGRDEYNNHELVEVGAVAVAWLEAIRRRI